MAQSGAPSAVQSGPALPAERTGKEIYQAACAACHGLDGRAKKAIGRVLPDYRRARHCGIRSGLACVVHERGRIRGLDITCRRSGRPCRRTSMRPSIMRTFCLKAVRGCKDLNLPRAFFTKSRQKRGRGSGLHGRGERAVGTN